MTGDPRLFGATLRQAVSSAGRSVAAVAAARRTFVAPPKPHPPLTGTNTLGAKSTKPSCCSRVSFTIPKLASGAPSVAKIFPRTRKSG